MIRPLAFVSLLLLCPLSLFASLAHESFYIENPRPGLARIIQQHPELTLDHPSSKGFELHGPKGTKQWLDTMGVEYREASLHGLKSDKAFLNYPSHEQITSSLKALAQKYPKIMKLFSIGKSVQGKELWMVKISDNVEIDETEPEFKYISSMHGDEITGRELTQFWIKDLLESYGHDPEATALVDNTEIFVMPSMNPDGSERRMRGNSNWTDLNRNFPDWTRGEVNSPAGRQPETQAVMDFQSKRQFSLSANFHGGAVVVNYPWDSTYDRHPFDQMVKEISLDYASLNPEMKNSWEFEDGVTNGADWYKVKGGMQDWSYYFHNDLQVTIELSERKWPNYADIPRYYRDNKASMFALANAVHQGAGFKLSRPIDGRVELYELFNGKRISKGAYGFRNGEFYKVLPPGDYLFEIQTTDGIENARAQVRSGEPRDNGNYVYL